MTAETARPRTLTEALRSLTPRAVVRLLEHRPDLMDPRPLDLPELAARSTTTASTTRALDQLDAWNRLVAESLAALPDPCSRDDLRQLLEAPTVAVAAAVQDLRERALLWGNDDQLHLVRSVREAFQPYPLGLAPPSARPLSTDELTAALRGCTDEARAVLDRLTWSPTGAVKHATRLVTPTSARTPVELLLAQRLLRPLDEETVILPREVAWHLRSGRATAAPVPTAAPTLSGPSRRAELVDRAAAGAAYGLLHDVELVAYELESTPHRLLRTGGLGLRDVASLARKLGRDAAYATFVLECAAAAGLIGPAAALTLLPTPEVDRWSAAPSPDRWLWLVRAWASSSRLFARSAEPGAHALGPEADTSSAPALRSMVMELVAAVPVGTTLALGPLAEAAAWRRPRLTHGPLDAATFVGWTWREASWLGLVALDAVSAFAAAAGRPGELPAELADLFPATVDRLIIQADLTAVAPGPLTHELTGDLRKLADQESRGGGGVFRFSAGSVRRAFDAGWSAAEIHRWLAQHSTTPVPQPLAYLVDDVARRHGSIRIGTAASYLRIDDEAQAEALLGHPGAAALGLRRVAPGLLVADGDAVDVVELLHRIGHTPAVEDASGSLVTTPAQARAPRVFTPSVARPDPARVADQILVGDRERPTRQEPKTSTDAALHSLRSATSSATPVRVAYVGQDGAAVERELTPLDVTAGAFRAVDAENAQIITIPLARIASISLAGSTV